MKTGQLVYVVIEQVCGVPHVHVRSDRDQARSLIRQLLEENAYPEDIVQQAYDDGEFSEGDYQIIIDETRIDE